mmetsp:Transcript_76362/g.151369  ORF Transcript_76362/g.151369 Transcript_76362/m.151369 type:complete len:279 (-) Transcript_76362:305-1141(-)
MRQTATIRHKRAKLAESHWKCRANGRRSSVIIRCEQQTDVAVMTRTLGHSAPSALATAGICICAALVLHECCVERTRCSWTPACVGWQNWVSRSKERRKKLRLAQRRAHEPIERAVRHRSNENRPDFTPWEGLVVDLGKPAKTANNCFDRIVARAELLLCSVRVRVGPGSSIAPRDYFSQSGSRNSMLTRAKPNSSFQCGGAVPARIRSMAWGMQPASKNIASPLSIWMVTGGPWRSKACGRGVFWPSTKVHVWPMATDIVKSDLGQSVWLFSVAGRV